MTTGPETPRMERNEKRTTLIQNDELSVERKQGGVLGNRITFMSRFADVPKKECVNVLQKKTQKADQQQNHIDLQPATSCFGRTEPVYGSMLHHSGQLQFVNVLSQQ